MSLLDNLLSAYREVFPGTSISVTADLRAAFEQGDTHRIINELNTVIGSIPYDLWRAYIYALELKLDASASEALDQIFEKGYLQPYAGDERKKLAIGIAFSSEQRNIADYRVKEL